MSLAGLRDLDDADPVLTKDGSTDIKPSLDHKAHSPTHQMGWVLGPLAA